MKDKNVRGEIEEKTLRIFVNEVCVGHQYRVGMSINPKIGGDIALV